MTLRAGSSIRDKNGIVIKVVRIFQHPLFNPRTFDYDCSILKFDRSIIFGGYLQPVKLPSEGEVLQTGTSCLVSGFGLTENFEYPNELLVTVVKIVNQKKCKANYAAPGIDFNITARMICSGEDKPTKLDGNSDACSGDSVRY